VLVNPYSRQAFEPDKTAAFAVLASAMGLAWLAGLLAGREGSGAAPARERRWRGALCWAGLVGVSIVVSSALSIDPWSSWAGSYVRRQGAATEILLLAFFALVALRLTERRQWLRLAAVVVLTSVPICVYTLFQRFGSDPMPWAYALRVGATAGNPVFLAAYLALLAPLTLVLVVEQLRRRDHTPGGVLRLGLLLYVLAMQIASLLLTESRGPILALAVGALFMALAGTRLVESARLGARRSMKWARWAVVALGLTVTATLA
jgi:hypothetical protein